MRVKAFIGHVLVVVGGCAAPRITDPYLAFASLPRYENGPGYKLEPFIAVAMSFQAMGREAGSAALLRIASTNSELRNPGVYEQVVVLCRMLFTFRNGLENDRPPLGQPGFFGDTEDADWPLEPIELVNGYPFWIVSGYPLGGARGPASMYVSYCITNCDWNTYRYRNLSETEKRAALAKLLSSPKWKRPLDEREKWCLSSQITSAPLDADRPRP